MLSAAVAMAISPLLLLVFVRWPVEVFFVSLLAIPMWFTISVPVLGGLHPSVFVGAISGLVIARRSTYTPAVQFIPSSLLGRVVFAFSLLFIAIAAVSGTVMATGLATKVPAVYWLIPLVYGILIGRSQGSWRVASNCIRIGGLMLGAAAISETIFGWRIGDLFPILDQGAASLANYQERGGLIRAEVTWGHGIALGGALAASIYYWVCQRDRPVLGRSAACAVIVAGAVATGSRSAVISAAIALALGAVTIALQDDQHRLGSFLLVIIVISAGVGSFLGQDQVVQADYDSSDTYRAKLFSLANTTSNMLGPAGAYSMTSRGPQLGPYRYIDNSVLQALVSSGWIAAGLLVLLLLAIVLALIRIKSSGTVVAPLALQLPTLLSAGFFTQHQILFWLLVGIAVVKLGGGGADVRESDPSGREPNRTCRKEARIGTPIQDGEAP